jgi:adenylate cyclase
VAIDFEAEGLLDGLSGSERDARGQLLEELAADGVPLDELRQAVEQDRLALLPVERLLEGEGKRYTVSEIAELAGVDVDMLRRQRQAMGLPTAEPDEEVFTDDDLEGARRLRTLLDAGLPEDGLLETARVMALAMSQIAAANNALVGQAMLHPGDTELEAAHRYVEAARSLRPLLGPALEHILNLHFREQLRQAVIGQAERAAGALPGSQEVTACFADLVGFTKLGERLAVEELGAVTGRLNELARDVAQGPVRLVKLIGDAAMLVSPDNDALLESALALVEAAEEDSEFPSLRAGVARGPALPRAGDWYGRPVNLASRITGVARPDTVVCSEEVREAADADFRWSRVGHRHLKGVRGAVRLFRVRRVASSGA